MRTKIHAFFFLLSFILIQLGGRAQTVYKDPAFITAVLEHHNTYRSALHLPPLTWSDALASDALAWAKHLAVIGKGEHDQRAVGLEGENLWWGTAGAYAYGDMVDFWGGEKQDFLYGTFPDCKASRSAVVGHYTQMVWKNTRSVGCAVASNGKLDILVCRYSPPGNIIGQKPY